MKRSIFPFLFLFLPGLLPGQSVVLKTMGGLPSTVSETSGLETTGRNRIWTHNDSGGQPKLYQLDSTGALVRTVTVLNASNVDWEDLAQNDLGDFFIGDFGNNSNNRQNLRIFRIQNPDSLGSDSATAGVISFSYPDQYGFPPPAARQNFDMEAMVAAGDSLYLFSKNRTNPWNGFTKLYRLPQDTGTYVAELLDSFYTGPGPQINDWVTAADISPDGQSLALLGHGKLWLFTCFNGFDFFGGKSRTINLGTFSQKEGINFISPDELYLTDEELFPLPGPNLYYADLSAWIGAHSALGADTSVVADSLYLLAGPSSQSYLWSTGHTGPGIWVNASGTYWVQITSADSCTTISDTITVTFQPGSGLEPGEILLGLYPNPVTAGSRLHLGIAWEPGLGLNLTDLHGRTLPLGEVVPAGKGCQLKLPSGLPAGLYLLRVEKPDGRTLRGKILVK